MPRMSSGAPMSTNIAALHKEKHKNLKLKSNDLSQSGQAHIIPLVAQEFPRIAGEMPIIFIKDSESGQFRAVAMTGLKVGENLFYKNGKWDTHYVPAVLRAEPFSLGRVSDSESVLCVNESSSLLSESEGRALFDDDGNETTLLTSMRSFVVDLVQHNVATQTFIEFLAEKQLLVASTITVKTGEGESEGHKLQGVYRINEDKLNELSDKMFLEMREKGYLSAIYAHIASQAALVNLRERAFK